MSDRSSLEKALSNWTYRKEGKMQIVATAEMRRQHTALLRNNRIPHPDLSPVERRARMELNGNPLRYKSEVKDRPSHEPTPERITRANGTIGKITTKIGGEKETRTTEVVRNYKIRDIVEQHGEKFEFSHREALVRFMVDSAKVQAVRVANLHSSGSGGGYGRLGGLGNVRQEERDKLARDQWIRSQLAPEFLLTANVLVTRDLLKPDGTAFSMEDFGEKIFPTVQDRNRRWGISAGALWGFASQLVILYKNCPIRVRKVDDHERALELEHQR